MEIFQIQLALSLRKRLEPKHLGFYAWPTWNELSSEVVELFEIPHEQFSVSAIPKKNSLISQITERSSNSFSPSINLADISSLLYRIRGLRMVS
jgi:hypothetical protein